MNNMTVKIPKPTMTDRILNLLGKKRAIHIPDDVHKEYSPYGYMQAQRESFLKALLRKKGEELPEGWVYLEDLSTKDD